MIKILDDLVGKWELAERNPMRPIFDENDHTCSNMDGTMCAAELRAAIPVVEAQQNELVEAINNALSISLEFPCLNGVERVDRITGDKNSTCLSERCRRCRLVATLARVKGA